MRCLILSDIVNVCVFQSIPLVINGVQCGDAETVTSALEEISQAMEGMTDALKLMHGTTTETDVLLC